MFSNQFFSKHLITSSSKHCSTRLHTLVHTLPCESSGFSANSKITGNDDALFYTSFYQTHMQPNTTKP